MPTVSAPTATKARRPRPSRASRRVGYVVGAAVNAVLLLAANVRPGWAAVPFLTDDTRLVLGLVNAALVAGLVVNGLSLVRAAKERTGV